MPTEDQNPRERGCDLLSAREAKEKWKRTGGEEKTGVEVHLMQIWLPEEAWERVGLLTLGLLLQTFLIGSQGNSKGEKNVSEFLILLCQAYSYLSKEKSEHRK